jgi:hypothetical protein
MVAPKRIGRFQWKYNFVLPKKKTTKIPVKLLKQFGGKLNKKVIKAILKKWDKKINKIKYKKF